MLNEWKKSREDCKWARQVRRCAEGKHAWVLYTESTMVPEQHADSLPRTERIYKCSACGKERKEVFQAGQPPRDPLTSAQYNSL